MIDEDVKLEISQLIQDYFLWAFNNPEGSCNLSELPSLQQPSKGKTTHSDLLGFARWVAQDQK